LAGPVNLMLAYALGTRFPAVGTVSAAVAVGFLAYGVSLVLFIVAMRNLGTARAAAYFSIAPFFGAVLAVALGDAVTWALVVAGALMGIGIWLHLSERHHHRHRHVPVTHEHWHSDDEHHHHPHPEPVPAGTWHMHPHAHKGIEHSHEHYPDAHHRHGHDEWQSPETVETPLGGI